MSNGTAPAPERSVASNLALLILRVACALPVLYQGGGILFGAFAGPGPQGVAAHSSRPPEEALRKRCDSSGTSESLAFSPLASMLFAAARFPAVMALRSSWKGRTPPTANAATKRFWLSNATSGCYRNNNGKNWPPIF